MSRLAREYVGGIVVAGALITFLSFPHQLVEQAAWLPFGVFTALLTLVMLVGINRTRDYTYYANTTFLFAGLLLLPFLLFVLMVLLSHFIGALYRLWLDQARSRPWYSLPFNIAMHIIAGCSAYVVYNAFDTGLTLFGTATEVFAALMAALTYICVSTSILGLAMVLVHQLMWHEVINYQAMVIELVSMCLGYIVTVVWSLNPWLIIPTLAPLIVVYQALMVPQLQKEAQTDPKTGLYNSRYFNQLFEAELERARRFERTLSVIMADLDDLRGINNTYGHLAGDTVISGIAGIIRSTIRTYDIAARFGGEEYCIVMPEAGPAEACALAERLRAAVEAASFKLPTTPIPIRVTMSVGVACFPWDGASTVDLTHKADVAVYHAKAQGRNRVICSADLPATQGHARAEEPFADAPIALAEVLPPSYSPGSANQRQQPIDERWQPPAPYQQTSPQHWLHSRQDPGALLEDWNDELFLALLNILDSRDPCIVGRAHDVAKFATALAGMLGMPKEHIARLYKAALLHDVGKIAISECVLQKPGQLTSAEYTYVKQQIGLGADLLEQCEGLRELAPFIRHHYERWDGTGYPEGLCGEQIPMESRILAVCNAVVAMISEQPYRRALTPDEVLSELKRCAGSHFDPDVVAAFCRLAQQSGHHLFANTFRAAYG